jgi:arginyl-tRNA synthetase
MLLALSGNTAPYMLYAFARINGINRKLGEEFKIDQASAVCLEHPAEMLLARYAAECCRMLPYADVC